MTGTPHDTELAEQEPQGSKIQNPQSKTQNQEWEWWQTGIIYQVYPRSFKDSNADGVGDLPGIISKMDYFPWLGVDAIWLSPIYPSPMADFGYDVADYTAVNSIFGTLDDFDLLVKEAHRRQIRVILDFVPNHTSEQHPWFVESRSSRDNPYRDWYLWADPAPDGGPPNNWLSVFGGSAWEWDEKTGQYYLHSYLKEQPDVNWRNPRVHDAMLDVMRFWLDRGVDGFRVDVLPHMIKDELLRDEPANPHWHEGMDPYAGIIHMHSNNQPEVHDVTREFRKVLDSYDHRMMVGETYLPLDELMKFYGQDLNEAHLPFNFELVQLPRDPIAIRRFVDAYEGALPQGAWPNWVLGNHDRHRVGSRWGIQEARVGQMLLLTLRGTPTCYYGDEIGMTDVEIPPEDVQDPWEKNLPGMGLGRDPERTPMQWDSSANAGFSTAKPWLPVAANYKEVNVEVEKNDPTSMLSLYRALTHLRRATTALTTGTYTSVESGHADVYAYLREHESDRIMIVLNFGTQNLSLDLGNGQAKVLVSTQMDREDTVQLNSLQLRPNEGVIARVTG